MSDLLSVLANAGSSLAAQQALQATAGHNVENANTPGFARQRVSIAAVQPAESVNGQYIGRGATVQAITQARDRFLEAQIPVALGQAASSAAEADALSSVHALDPTAPGSLGDALSSFYASLQALTRDPGNTSLRTAALGSATGLAASFQRTRGALESTRTGIDQQVSGLVSQVNAEAAQVAELNVQIRIASAGGGSPNDLLDARQQHLDTLAQLVGATPVPTSGSDVQVMLAGGVALVSGDRAGTLSTSTRTDGHLGLAIALPGSAGAQPLATSLGGQMGGALAARDGALAEAVSGLDHLAYDVAGAVNAVHAASYGVDGSTGLDLFQVGTSLDGAAAVIAVNAAVGVKQLATAGAAAAPGDAAGALALVATQDAALASSGTTLQATLSSMTSAFGTAASRAQAFSENDAALRDHLTNLRESASGVSVDDELIAMQAAQRGYQAITQVIQVADSMLDTLLKLR